MVYDFVWILSHCNNFLWTMKICHKTIRLINRPIRKRLYIDRTFHLHVMMCVTWHVLSKYITYLSVLYCAVSGDCAPISIQFIFITPFIQQIKLAAVLSTPNKDHSNQMTINRILVFFLHLRFL